MLSVASHDNFICTKSSQHTAKMSLNQLSMLLGLPDSELQQILDYAKTLSKPEAADHFKNFLGDSPAAIEFIAAFNSQRRDPKPSPVPTSSRPTPASSQPTSDADAVPKRPRQQPKKKKNNLHTPAPRQVVETNPGPGTVYNKKSIEDEYMTGGRQSAVSSSTTASSKPAATAALQKAPKPPANGTLVSDLLAPKSKPKQHKPTPTSSRSSTPGPTTTTKVSITGGTPMHGASGALADLDAAIRALEITTNPTALVPDDKRRCNCVATRHPLQTAAPNCLSCGKVICLKEGLGPCTSCGQPLLAPQDVQAMIRELKEERGRERMAADRAAHKKAEVSTAPRAFTKARTGYDDDDNNNAAAAAAAKAREHRDRLLGFQAQNARRTTVRDEAADFDVSGWGSRWCTPEERARELKRQQKLVREMEWNARPEYEKRQQVVSIDLVGGKVVKKFVARERPATPEEEEDEAMVVEATSTQRVQGGGGGAFSKNPLLGGLIKPVYDAKGKGAELEGRKDRATRWRRVQDDLDNNEAVILDGGVYGGASDEPGRG